MPSVFHVDKKEQENKNWDKKALTPSLNRDSSKKKKISAPKLNVVWKMQKLITNEAPSKSGNLSSSPIKSTLSNAGPHRAPKQYRCKICGKIVSSGRSCRLHIKDYHPRLAENMTLQMPIKCPVPSCGNGFLKREQLVAHAAEIHANDNSSYDTIKKIFSSEAQFLEWKNHLETESNASFTKTKGETTNIYAYFNCSRDVPLFMHSKLLGAGRKNLKWQRRHCTAFLHVRKKGDSLVVTGCIDHLGHDDFTGLVPLSDQDRNYLLTLLRQGVSKTEIIKRIRTKFPTKAYRLYFLSFSDLSRLVQTYKIPYERNLDDVGYEEDDNNDAESSDDEINYDQAKFANIGRIPVYDAREFQIVGQVEPSLIKNPVAQELAKLKETISDLEKNIDQPGTSKDSSQLADLLQKTNSLLRNKLEAPPTSYLETSTDDIPVIQEEIVETSTDVIQGGYYEVQDADFYGDHINHLQEVEVGQSSIMSNFMPIQEANYPQVSSRSRLIQATETSRNSRLVYYVIQHESKQSRRNFE